MYLSFQTTNLQTHRAKPLPKKEATAVIVKFSAQIVSKVLIFHILNKKPHLQWSNYDSQMRSGKTHFM